MHSAWAGRAKRRAHLTHLSERLSTAPRPGLVSESHLAEAGLRAHARGHPAGSVVRSVRPHRNARGLAASQQRSAGQISQELPGAERIRDRGTPDVLRKRPAAYRDQGNCPRPAPHPCPTPTPRISDRTQLGPKEVTPGSDPNSAGTRDQILAGLSGSASSTTGIIPSTLAGLCGDPMSWKM